MEKEKDYVQLAKEILRDWDKHYNYLSNKNLINVMRESVMFYEGNHYYKKVYSDVDLPKVVFNVIKMIIDNKASNILSTPFDTHFSSSSSPELVERMNRFDKYILKELDHDILNRLLVNSSLVKGTHAIHYYWVEDIVGQSGLYKGGLRAEIIDPLRVAVANPRVKDIQAQKYITIQQRLEVKTVKKIADKEVDLSLIKPDDLDRQYNNEVEQEQENDDTGMVTVYNRYFRVDGEVYLERSIKDTIINKPKPLNPNLYKAVEYRTEKEKEDEKSTNKENIDMDSIIMTADTNLEQSRDDNEKFYLYPIEMNCLTQSDDSIYGLSDVSPLIMAQKMVNLYFATIYKKSMDDVFPKYFAKKGALQQEITGMPNEVITDYSNTNGWGIQKVEGIQYANGQFALGQTLVEFMKNVSNSRDVLQGETVGANMSALAIQSLQTQAEKPIAQQRELFMQSLIRMARIRVMFYKFYYDEKDFAYEMDEVDYDSMIEQNGFSENGLNRTVGDTFRGSDYANMPFRITVDVGRGTKYDAITAQETINQLFNNGNFTQMDADTKEQFYYLLDDNLFPQKYVLKALIRKQRMSENSQLKAQVEQLTTENQELQMALEQLKIYLEALKKQYTESINVANEQIKDAEQRYANANDTIMNIANQGNNTNK